jgi:hypothetical protein
MIPKSTAGPGNWFLLFVAAAATAGVAATAQTPAPRPVLVELFTSEGCSSCPPADELLRRLQGLDTGSGQLIVALSEHVTYWNRLGWADPFSAETFTERQRVYGDRFHLDSVYTPQAVVNGDLEMNGSDGAAILRAVRAEKAPASPTTASMLHIAGAERSGGSIAITFSLTGAPAQGGELFAVLADDMDTSRVARGENAGHTLSHVAVARALVRLGTLKSAALGTTTTVKLPNTATGNSGAGQHVVLFAQAKGQGSILALASAPVRFSAAEAGGRRSELYSDIITPR